MVLTMNASTFSKTAASSGVGYILGATRVLAGEGRDTPSNLLRRRENQRAGSRDAGN